MSSLKALERMKADLIKIQCELFDDNCNDERVLAVYQLEDYQTIKQDLKLLEQLKQNHDKTLINNGELVVKVADLQKENQELIVNKNVAQAVALNQKREIAELKDQVDYFKEDSKEWQSAYEWSQAQNAILKLENQELKEIIKANFFYHKNSEEIGYRKTMPKYQDKIKEVLGDE